MKLPKKVKAKWLKALRSGEYKQTKGTLYNPKTGGFCCLGVLEHVCMNGEVEYVPGLGYPDEPSLDFYDYAGIDAGLTFDDDDVTELVMMNDGDKRIYMTPRKFKTIANWIEKNIPTLD